MSKVKQSTTSYRAPAADGLLDILEYMSENPGGYGPTELSGLLGLSDNLVFRTLHTLENRGYVCKNKGGKYSLNNKLFSLGMKLQRTYDLRKIARPHLEALSEETGETCQLQIPDNDRMLVYDVVTPTRDYYFTVETGTRLYYHANAFGKCLLAYMSERQRREILEGQMPAFTSETKTSLSALERELELIRKNGFASEKSEYVTGIYCLGAPLFDSENAVIGALGITGIVSRFDRKAISVLRRKVIDCAATINELLR